MYPLCGGDIITFLQGAHSHGKPGILPKKIICMENSWNLKGKFHGKVKNFVLLVRIFLVSKLLFLQNVFFVSCVSFSISYYSKTWNIFCIISSGSVYKFYYQEKDLESWKYHGFFISILGGHPVLMPFNNQDETPGNTGVICPLSWNKHLLSNLDPKAKYSCEFNNNYM